MENKYNIDLTVIIPVYNAEKYLEQCVESLMFQGDPQLEIILVNDGSTDRSGVIADRLALRDNRIKVFHQDNKGASAARNVGLETAQGEYIAFVDSDDWLKKKSLDKLYRTATRHRADVVMGIVDLSDHGDRLSRVFKPIPKSMMNIPFAGKEGFVRLAETCSYTPMSINYIYRRGFLEKIQARFEEGIICEDELWTPVVLYQASVMVIADVDFYFYRQHLDSVMHATNTEHRLKSLFRVTDKLLKFADQFDFTGEDGAFKNWLYVITFRLYKTAFYILPGMKDSSYPLPELHWNRLKRDSAKMTSRPQKICEGFLREAEDRLKQ